MPANDGIAPVEAVVCIEEMHRTATAAVRLGPADTSPARVVEASLEGAEAVDSIVGIGPELSELGELLVLISEPLAELGGDRDQVVEYVGPA